MTTSRREHPIRIFILFSSLDFNRREIKRERNKDEKENMKNDDNTNDNDAEVVAVDHFCQR